MGKIVWLTGLSGAGKSTLALNLKKKLLNKKKTLRIKIIDGDLFRKKNKLKKSFTKKNIIYNNKLIINYVSKIFDNFDYIIVSVISPLKCTRIAALKTFGINYFEIFLNCPIKFLEKRDVKGLYLMAKKKKINNLIGYNSTISYETSSHKKLTIKTHIETIDSSTLKILKFINKE